MAEAQTASTVQSIESSFPYAIVRTGGKQYKVAEGDQILVEKLELEPGATWTADEVLFVAQKAGSFEIGKPLLSAAKVEFEVLQQTVGSKILVRHFRRRQSSIRSLGHRQSLTRLVVKSIKV